MTDNKQRELRLRPPVKGRKRQNIHRSPRPNDEPAEVIRVRTPECLKTFPRSRVPAPNRYLFQPPRDQFYFSRQPVHQNTDDTTSQSLKQYTVIPGYQMIESLEPQEFAQHEKLTNQVIYDANILIDGPLRACSEVLLNQFLFKVDEMPGNTAVDMDMKTQKPLAKRIQRVVTNIDSLLSQNLSYSSVLQSNPTRSLQSEARAISRKAPSHTTGQAINPERQFVVEVTQKVPTKFNPLPLHNEIEDALPSCCTTWVYAIQRSCKGNFIFYMFGKVPEIIQISSL
ncbi:hypothetical protein HOY80DRAFT_1040194 [Tuber brumale]|nr:hypothetical protein HOY80DRAFT_1040194 [Tuber brumale]